MKPTIPVVPGMDLPVTVYAKDQPEYEPLPCWRDSTDPHGTILVRWHLTWGERLRVFFVGDVYQWILTFGRPLQPQRFEVAAPFNEVEDRLDLQEVRALGGEPS